jgi:hypothetical protein
MIEGRPSERLEEGAAECVVVDWERDVPPCPAPPHILAGGQEIRYEGGR